MEECKVAVEYACDERGNHDAPILDCLESKTKEFDSLLEAVSFIQECTYIFNLDTLFEKCQDEEVPDSLKGQVFNFHILN